MESVLLEHEIIWELVFQSHLPHFVDGSLSLNQWFINLSKQPFKVREVIGPLSFNFICGLIFTSFSWHEPRHHGQLALTHILGGDCLFVHPNFKSSLVVTLHHIESVVRSYMASTFVPKFEFSWLFYSKSVIILINLQVWILNPKSLAVVISIQSVSTLSVFVDACYWRDYDWVVRWVTFWKAPDWTLLG